MPRWVTIVLVSLLLIVLQTTVIRFLAIESIAPDLLLLWAVIVGIRYGHIAGTTTGFGTGVLLDLLSGADGMLGLAALTKTIAGFLAGYFFNENKTEQTLGSYRFLLITAGIALVHNLLYFVILLQGSGIRWWNAALFYGIPGMLYTTAVGVLPMFFIARKHLT
jgi:rod shape-determining protein MreD